MKKRFAQAKCLTPDVHIGIGDGGHHLARLKLFQAIEGGQSLDPNLGQPGRGRELPE